MRFPKIPILACILLWSWSAMAAPSTKPATKPAQRIVIIIDAGGMMLPEITTARALASQKIAKLDDGVQFNVIAMTEQPKGVLAFREKLVAASEDSRNRASAFMENLAPRGGPNLAKHVEAAMKMKPQAIYIFAGAHRGEEERPMKVSKDVQISVIAFAATGGVSESLMSLTTSTGGSCVDEKGEAITRVLEKSAEEKGTIIKEEKGRIVQ